MSPKDQVGEYFDKQAKRFDAIYEDRKPLYQRVVDYFRRVVVERLHLTLNLMPLSGQWTALDVGCGSGRYGIALSRVGADRVVGLDVSPEMIDLARHELRREGSGDRCEFFRTDFLAFETGEKFDVVLGMGYFDYIEDPLAHVKKMVELCQGRMFVSFPKRWEIRVPIRKLRFMAQNTFVRFYSRQEIRDIFEAAGLPPERFSLIDLGRDWIAIVRVG